ncbi:hypothetical protein SAMN04488029_1581 [Reichenbachiella faecimaris]|uniref:Uncharacterized protein n=1 Tax=Reichenbachiella faecimaris TaxID=692418 RepID=A0A1W2G996_REIFA|nr:hypothetical protein [Reichenbachiella faecimaris]SMD33237.1 hypothetical protein SAMN04488029_1581 [Reichenbachiella faecimaris]
MRISLTAILLFLMQCLCAQDIAHNKALFNITQLTYVIVNDVTGVAQSNLENPRAVSLNTIFGYFIVPEKLSIGIGFGLDLDWMDIAIRVLILHHYMLI